MMKTQEAPKMSNRDRAIAAHRAAVLAQEAQWRAIVEATTPINWGADETLDIGRN